MIAVLREALPIFVVAGLYAAVYETRVRRLAPTTRAVPGWRRACFYGGLALIVIALVPPIGIWDDRLLWVHMSQHLLLGDLATLLLVLGLTGPLIAPLLRMPLIARLRGLAHPVTAAALWTVDLYFWHTPFAYQAAVRHDAIHVLEHALFIFFGFNMWMALLGPLPKPAWFGNFARLMYVIAVRVVTTVLANIFIWAHVILYPQYGPSEARYGLSPGADQVTAGSILMIEGSILTIVLFGWLFMRTARQAEERQDLLDFASAHGAVLSDERAARAIAAGRGEELRRRVAAGGAKPGPGGAEPTT